MILYFHLIIINRLLYPIFIHMVFILSYYLSLLTLILPYFISFFIPMPLPFLNTNLDFLYIFITLPYLHLFSEDILLLFSLSLLNHNMPLFMNSCSHLLFLLSRILLTYASYFSHLLVISLILLHMYLLNVFLILSSPSSL